mmetsp:Transcript_84567/g.244341  ORF Transcript_84567/g.244341 Transcript_84567/m.244341 type:complete len:166 (+) Transcript_84567:792-1289(+)
MARRNVSKAASVEKTDDGFPALLLDLGWLAAVLADLVLDLGRVLGALDVLFSAPPCAPALLVDTFAFLLVDPALDAGRLGWLGAASLAALDFPPRGSPAALALLLDLGWPAGRALSRDAMRSCVPDWRLRGPRLASASRLGLLLADGMSAASATAWPGAACAEIA